MQAPNGLIYIVDAGNNRIQAIDPTGELRHEWGSWGSMPGQLAGPSDLAVHGGEVFVADTLNDRIEVFDLCGACRRSVGVQLSRRLNRPVGVAISQASTLFVTDRNNYRVVALTTEGEPLFEWGESGTGPGCLDWPAGIAVAGDEVFVCDSGNHRVQVFTALDGTFCRSFGGKAILSTGAPDEMKAPFGIAVACGIVFVSQSALGYRHVSMLPQGSEARELLARLCPRFAHGALHHVSATADGRLLVCDHDKHCVHALIPMCARMRRFRVAGRLIQTLCAWHGRASHRLYAPGGQGYEVAAASFASCILDASCRRAVAPPSSEEHFF